MTETETRLLLVEDDHRMADAICAVLSSAGYVHTDVAKTAASAETKVRSQAPDMLLVDLGLPDRDGSALICALRSSHFRKPILVLTSALSDDRVLDALRAGADGYLFKDDLETRLPGALRDLAGGGAALSGGAARAMLRELGIESRPPNVPVLTKRQSDVLSLLASGASYAEIAADLGVRVNSVRTHIRSIYERLGVLNRAEAVNMAWTLRLLRRGP